MLRDATTARAADVRLFANRTLRAATLPFSLCLLLLMLAGLPSTATAQITADDCQVCDGQLDSLRVIYTGTSGADITIDPQRGSSVTYTNVQNGDEIGIGPSSSGSNRLGSETTFIITPGTNVTFHTSCSQPIGPGISRGDIFITYASSRNNGYTCPTLDKTSTSHPDPVAGSDAAGDLNFAPNQESETVTYQITLFNTGSASLTVDPVVDQLSTTSSTTPMYVPGSTQYNGSPAGDPTITNGGSTLTFNAGGTFTLASGASLEITYQVTIPNTTPEQGGDEWPNTASTCFTTSNGEACAQDNYLVFGGGNLPVELVAFDAVLDGSSVQLSWATASETNNAGFYLEMSEGALAKDRTFESLAFVDGHGTTLEAQRYGYRIDALEPGRYTFRLKQVDYDGTFDYSPEVEVVVGLAQGFLMEPAYPNPFSNRAELRIAVQREQAVRAELFDVLGRRVQVLFEGTAQEGQMLPVTIDGSALSNGIYLLRVTGERFSETQRVTLLK